MIATIIAMLVTSAFDAQPYWLPSYTASSAEPPIVATTSTPFIEVETGKPFFPTLSGEDLDTFVRRGTRETREFHNPYLQITRLTYMSGEQYFPAAARTSYWNGINTWSFVIVAGEPAIYIDVFRVSEQNEIANVSDEPADVSTAVLIKESTSTSSTATNSGRSE